jgi:TolB-like protein
MIYKYHVNLFILLILAQAIFAINNVAVLELLPNASVQEMISIEEGRHLTDELRRQAVVTLPASDYSVLTRDNIIALMPPNEEEAECLAQGCAVDIGRAIGAEYISQGTIGKFGKKLTISVELYETMGGKLLSSIVFESEDIEGLLNVVRKEAGPLFQKIMSKPLSEPRKALSESAIPPSESKFTELKNEQNKSGVKTFTWIGIGLAVAGIGAGVYGVLQNSEYEKLRKDYSDASADFDKKWKNMEDAKGRRNLSYIICGALLASGITIYFVF